MSSFIIRTSDRNTFRRCRELWNFRSPIREAWEYSPGIEPLDFGIAYHTGMDVYYDPKRWTDAPALRQIVEYEAELAFLKYLDEWKKRLIKAGYWENQKERHDELAQLGLGMMQHYFKWAPKHDKGWKPVKSEIEFEVPIPVPAALKSFVDKAEHLCLLWDRELGCEVLGIWDVETHDWATVYYQGRIDLIVEFPDGTYGILDHKTAAQFGQTEHLDLDTQCRSYAWACMLMLGLPVSRIIYSEHRKGVPKPPLLLKKGMLSKNKNQGTTVELYLEKIRELGHERSWYEDFLPKLEASQQEYFRRIEVSYSRNELTQTGMAICMEAIDMLSDPFIYPNPDRWNCNGCAFRTPCLMKQEGGDQQWHLRNSGLYIRGKHYASAK